MHERSLILALLKHVAQIQSLHDGAAVSEIAVELGPLSGVEPELLRSAYESLAEPGAKLVIHEVPLEVRCLACRTCNSMQTFESICPQCQSTDLQIIGGDTFRLLHVTLNELPSGNTSCMLR
jgi:hydrogenase nickel incorporation protein HypA/HybF